MARLFRATTVPADPPSIRTTKQRPDDRGYADKRKNAELADRLKPGNRKQDRARNETEKPAHDESPNFPEPATVRKSC